jgi:MFS family permease
MRERLPLFLGIFGVMALSNAIVPVLPAFGEGPALQSFVYSAYFLGAFLTVIPAGLLSDRVGRLPVIRAGLAITVASGLLILALRHPLLVLAGRGIEGVGAGLFVAAGMSWVNTRPDHEKTSGDFMASLNLGLVTGLLASGWIAEASGSERAGLLAFTLLCLIPAVLVFLVEESPARPLPAGTWNGIPRGHLPLYASAVVLVGVTGAVTSLYPEFTGASPQALGVAIAVMYLATVAGVFLASRVSLPPVPTIRAAAVLMAVSVLLLPFSPAAFALIGAVAGIVMIAQMAYLAGTDLPQGAVMGAYNAASYAGMTLLPFLAGMIAQGAGFLPAFLVIALLALSMAVVIGKCSCRVPGGGAPGT